MSFKPYKGAELDRLEKLIADMEKEVALRQQNIASLRHQLKEGQWSSDVDYSTLPKPAPSCYICRYSTPIIEKCEKGNKYGTACKEYRHFTDKT